MADASVVDPNQEVTNKPKEIASNVSDHSNAGDVAFLYKTMLQRDPSKRKVKPVEQHLMQIHFGMSDDDDTDSDYEFKPGAASDCDVGSDDSTGGLAAEKDKKDKHKLSEESDSDAESEDELSSGELESMKQEQPVVTSKLKFDLKVCCVCLTSSCDEDEIVECDGCGILVHEGCYGTIEEDVLSVHSDMSTESTEPWFCDPCKAGVVPTCELCPNQFGIFKQTDTGRWVHLICALYVPAVAFGNTEKLTNVTLLEMPYTKWGSKECSLCEDENYSSVGVCIGCDAGMCRCFFHVTCAQKQGLLSEASIDEEIADPFYAHCRMHGDKLVSKHKKRNFLALNSHVKHFRETKCNRPVSRRTKRRLEHFKKKFKEAEARRPPAWVPPNKLSRSISSSASAVNSLLRKAELLGMVPGSKNAQHKAVVTKKSYVAPALSVDFASYFEQRTAKSESLKKLNREYEQEKESLKEQEKTLGERIDKLRAVITELRTCHEESRQAGYEIYTALEHFSDQSMKIPEQYKPRGKLMSPSGIASMKVGGQVASPCGICRSMKEQHLLAQCDQCSNLYHLYCLDPPLTRMPKKSKLCGWVCSTCHYKNHQVPAEETEEVDTDAPRRLRQVVREPDKFIQPELKLFVEKFKKHSVRKASRNKPTKASLKKPKKHAINKKKVGTGQKGNESILIQAKENSELVESLEATTASTIKSPTDADTQPEGHLSSPLGLPPHSPIKLGRKSKVLEKGLCKPCNTGCNGANAVKCDGCLCWYHLSCLEPPEKKSPKPRGYQWYCDDCDKALEQGKEGKEGNATPSDGDFSESLTMEIVQGNDEKTVVSFDGDVTTI
ncbi:PHD finger protein 14-like [Watersipora subatra]|uniref:PHD finger protein 14-like n=1 Tax=Watersipora subatra TaxID=2589382 RepID=UPI00355B0101